MSGGTGDDGAFGSAVTARFAAAIIDHVAHPIFVKDREFRFVFLNRALCEMVGYSREEMLGKTDYDFFPRAEADFFRRKDEEMFATGARVTIDEEPITDSTGRRHVLATTKVPLRDETGAVTHVVGIIHDITPLKEAQEQLRVANERLETRVRERTRELVQAQQQLLRQERLAVLGQLTGGLAHQIRNPLGSISNAACLLQGMLAGDRRKEARGAVEIILEETREADRIITDLVQYARVRPPDPRQVSVSSLLTQLLATRTIPGGIAVEVHVPELPAVAVDPGQMRDALGNLVDNAVDAMPDGGTLRIEARREDGGVVISLEDSGTGIPPSVEDHLFEPLVTTKVGGIGLGLATARMLVENQGGVIRAERRVGRGARFLVTLPLVAGGEEGA